VTLFTSDQWLIVALVFLLGVVLGMALMAGGKWKRRYRDERARADGLETENRRLQKDSAEMDTLRQAAARDEARRRTDGPGPL
jgi:outer membrane murein-binding lipoprotein Lpp